MMFKTLLEFKTFNLYTFKKQQLYNKLNKHCTLNKYH